MVKPREVAGLGQKIAGVLLRGEPRALGQLERDPALELSVLCEVDDPEGTLAEPPYRSVSALDPPTPWTFKNAGDPPWGEAVLETADAAGVRLPRKNDAPASGGVAIVGKTDSRSVIASVS